MNKKEILRMPLIKLNLCNEEYMKYSELFDLSALSRKTNQLVEVVFAHLIV
jgi:hypothetical protein